jgi:diguanylate cyclase (GGDEF)-like protein/hemerythrin-like metal-binding protein
LFYDRLSQSISVARRHRQRLAVLYLDLDGFKAVNDTYGHQVGDATLKEAARRLQASVRDADTVARLGGDEFAVVLTEIKGALDAGQVASKIIGNVAVPMSLYDGRTYQIGVSIGISIYPDSGVEIDRLVKAADNAMYESKALGKNCFTYSVEHTVESPAADSWFGFVDDFLVGINVIDEQHQAMGDMLNKLNVALAMQEPLEALTQQFDELSAYAGFHFQTEERLMEQYRYPEVGAHKEEHLRLIGEMKYLKARFADGSELLVLQWIKDWLIGHISGADRRLSEYLMTRVER